MSSGHRAFMQLGKELAEKGRKGYGKKLGKITKSVDDDLAAGLTNVSARHKLSASRKAKPEPKKKTRWQKASDALRKASGRGR